MSGKRHIMSLLYWVKDWDKEMINNLGKAITNNFFGQELAFHIKDILQLR